MREKLVNFLNPKKSRKKIKTFRNLGKNYVQVS